MDQSLSSMAVTLLIPFLIFLVLFSALIIITRWYKRVPPNKFMIVFGRGQRGLGGGTIVTNGGMIVWPIINEAAFMNFFLYNLQVRVERVPTKNLVPLTVDAVVQVRIRNEEGAMRAAANLFLGREQEIPNTVTQVLEGKLREILATMDIEEVNIDRQAFAQQVQEVAVKALDPMGLGIVNFSIREIIDHDNYLKSLATRRVAEVSRDAQIAQAEANRDAAVRSAEANREAETARAIADAKIAEAQRDRDLNVIGFKRQTESASAEAEIAKEQRLAELKQNLVREQQRVELVRKEQDIYIAEKAVQAAEKQLDADVRKPAEANRFKTEQAAEAQKYASIADAQARAEGIKIVQLAEAEGIRARALAEAAGIEARGKAEAEALRLAGLAKAEALKQEALALQQMNEAGKLSMLLEVLPEVAKALAEPLAKIDRITIINDGTTGGGDSLGAGIGKVFGDVTKMMPRLQELVKATTGLDLTEALRQSLGQQPQPPAQPEPAKPEEPKQLPPPAPEEGS